MKDQILCIEQMQHLIELGVDVSNASLIWLVNRSKKLLCTQDLKDRFDEFGQLFPAFTLQDIIKLLPNTISLPNSVQYGLFIEYRAVYATKMVLSYKLNNSTITCREDNERYFNRQLLYSKCGEPKEVLYQVLCWCAENGYLKGGDK